MRFDNGGTNNASFYMLKRAADVNKAGYMLNGRLYTGNTNYFLTSIDFKDESAILASFKNFQYPAKSIAKTSSPRLFSSLLHRVLYHYFI